MSDVVSKKFILSVSANIHIFIERNTLNVAGDSLTQSGADFGKEFVLEASPYFIAGLNKAIDKNASLYGGRAIDAAMLTRDLEDVLKHIRQTTRGYPYDMQGSGSPADQLEYVMRRHNLI